MPPQLVELQCPAAGLRLKVPPGHTPRRSPSCLRYTPSPDGERRACPCGDTSHRRERARSIVSLCVRKLFPNDLAHHFGGQGPIILGKRGAQRLVDEGLVGTPGRFCFGTKSFDDIVIDPLIVMRVLTGEGIPAARLPRPGRRLLGGWITSGQRQCA